MTSDPWAPTRSLLARAGVVLEPGLSDAEIAAAEVKFGFRFPPDLRSLLSVVLPTGPQFPAWRNLDDTGLADRWAWPFEGLAFDMMNNAYWRDAWGARPASHDAALLIARSAYDAAPKMIPIFGHRYLPDSPHAAGNPVYSIYQTDIIVYGNNLAAYFVAEFGRDPGGDRPHDVQPTHRPTTPFWSDFVE